MHSNRQSNLETYTVCVKDLDYQGEMIIFESNLTTFKSIVVFEAAGTLVKIGLSLKPNHDKEI
jgi:hypothetical protein